VFDFILHKAKSSQLAKQDMMKTAFIFSDLQFDQGRSLIPESDFEYTEPKFTAAGYDVLVIVFWNLSSGTTHPTPLCFDTVGVAMVSG
jgi:hypothetical protein